MTYSTALRTVHSGGMLAFGIDLGGTKIEGAILDASGALVFRERIATEAAGGYRHVLDRIALLYRRMVDAAGGAPHTLGLGTPGSLSPASGLLRNSNTLALNGQPVRADLERLLGRDLTIANDANCFALAEARLGAGRGHRVVFGVIIGTGCGGGIVIDGRIHEGRQGIGGEWGHMSLEPAGPLCYCGHRGCVETYISGSGLERRYAEIVGEVRTAAAVAQAWQAGEPVASRVMDEFFGWFGRALANLVDILDPDIVVLGGGLSNIDALYERGVAEFAARVFSDVCLTPVCRHALGDSAGVFGAALLGK